VRFDNRGMHIEATWHRVSDGTWYMDQVTVRLRLIEADVGWFSQRLRSKFLRMSFRIMLSRFRSQFESILLLCIGIFSVHGYLCDSLRVGIGMASCFDGILFIAYVTHCRIKAVNMKFIMIILLQSFLDN
jgi:hypothetical protein